MPPKKTPVTSGKKKSTASSLKVKSSVKTKLPVKGNGSYLEHKESDVSTLHNPNTALSSTAQDSIMEFLQKLDSSNQDILRRMEALERRDSVSSTPVTSPKVAFNSHDPTYRLPQPLQTTGSQMQGPVTYQAGNADHQLRSTLTGRDEVFKPTYQGPNPSLDAVRNASNVAASVNQLLLRYQDLGRYSRKVLDLARS